MIRATWKVYLSKGHVNFFSQNSEKNNSVFQNSEKKQRKKRTNSENKVRIKINFFHTCCYNVCYYLMKVDGTEH